MLSGGKVRIVLPKSIYVAQGTTVQSNNGKL